MMYRPVSALSAEYGNSRQWGYKILREIKSCPRYKGRKVTVNEGFRTLVSVPVFVDYLEHRAELRHRNLARRLGEYDGE